MWVVEGQENFRERVGGVAQEAAAMSHSRGGRWEQMVEKGQVGRETQEVYINFP